jgi:Arc/MetJ-type ribon-helix-helix transcriptional regulator
MRDNVTSGGLALKVLQIEVPDRVAAELDALVKSGWFADEDELIRQALTEFVSRHGFALAEQFQREDIAWALRQRA